MLLDLLWTGFFFFSNSRLYFCAVSYFQVFLKQLQYWELFLALVSTSLVLGSSIMGNTPNYIISGYEETLRYIWRMILLINFNFVEGSDCLQFLEIPYQILWRIPEKQTFVFPGWKSSIWGQLREFYPSRVDSLATDKRQGHIAEPGGLDIWTSAEEPVWLHVLSCTAVKFVLSWRRV